MYKIIGADQKTYGPISREQILQWISEGRANAQTQVQAEGSDEWKPLSTYPEFANAFAGQASLSPSLPGFQPAGNRDSALQAVKGPAIALKVTAILGLIGALLGLVLNVLTLAGFHFGLDQFGDPNVRAFLNGATGVLGIFQSTIRLVLSVVLWKGASKMEALQNHQFAFTASIIAMVPCVSPCCWLGLPFGIWALVVLNRPAVKSQFSPG
jgi:GYF domain 2